MQKEIEFVGGYWRYVKRSVNLNNFTISYTHEGGFTSRKDAAEAKEIDDAQYERDLKKMKKIGNIQYTFKEYMEYWLTSAKRYPWRINQCPQKNSETQSFKQGRVEETVVGGFQTYRILFRDSSWTVLWAPLG